MATRAKDVIAKEVRTLRLSITGQCNLECFYCKSVGKDRDLFDTKVPIQPSDVSKLVKILGELGITKVVIGGGEPLLRKDAPNFIKSAYAHKGIQEVRLVTNGTYLKAYADHLRKMGLRKVDVAFDSLSYEKYHTITKRDDLFRVLDGIEKVEKLNYPDIRLNITLLAGINHNEIIEFARMTKDRKLHIRFMEYRPRLVNGNDSYADRVSMSVIEAKRAIDNYQKLVQVHDLEEDIQAPTYQFQNSVGKFSFWSEIEMAQEKAIPGVVFNAEGSLYNEHVPNRPLNILADLRRDAKESRLHRAIERIMYLKPTPPRKKSAPKTTKTSVRRPASTTRRRRRSASA